MDSPFFCCTAFPNSGTDGHNPPNNGFILTKRLVLPYKKRSIRLPNNPANTTIRL
jgi:hypothetical protein